MTEAWRGRQYADIADLQRTLARESLRWLAWQPNWSVVDVGCGDGAVTEWIAGLVPDGQVLGLDLSVDQIKYARANHRMPNLRFDVADAANFAAAPADVVTSFNALHWVRDQPAAARCLAAAVRPGGRLLVRVVGESDRQSLEQTITAITGLAKWRQSFTNFHRPYEHRSPAQWRQVLADAGFHELELLTQDLVWDFGSRAGFCRWSQGTFGPWISRLPVEHRDLFIHDVLDAYAPVAGGEGIFRFVQLQIAGRR